MTRDDITRITRESGLPLHWVTATGVIKWTDLERFAALVAEAEREACARICDLVAREIDDTNGIATYIAAAIRARGTT